jgi:hypothetical protein
MLTRSQVVISGSVVGTDREVIAERCTLPA